MVATRTSIQRLTRTTALLGRVLLCLALLFNFTIFAVEDLHWSAADKFLDENKGPSAPLVAKTNEQSKQPNVVKEKLTPEPCCQFNHHLPFLSQPSQAQTTWHRRAPPSFNSLDCNAPFPPRAPTA